MSKNFSQHRSYRRPGPPEPVGPEKPEEKDSEKNPFLIEYSWLPTYSLRDVGVVFEDEDSASSTRKAE